MLWFIAVSVSDSLCDVCANMSTEFLTDFDEIFSRGGAWFKEQLIRFWWQCMYSSPILPHFFVLVVHFRLRFGRSIADIVHFTNSFTYLHFHWDSIGFM